jgi:hypothetical protein
MQSAPAWALLFVIASIPVAAQEQEATRIFLDGIGFVSIERTGQLRYVSPVAGRLGDLDVNGTAWGGGFAVGTFLAPRVSLRVEAAFPESLDSSYSMRTGLVVSSRLVDETQFFSDRVEEEVSRRSASVLAGYHTGRRSRVRLGFLAGVAFLWERQRSVVEQTVPPIVPFIPIRTQRFDVTTTSYRPAVTLGFDADVALARQVSVVPQMRVQAVAGMLSLRPGIAVRWTP